MKINSAKAAVKRMKKVFFWSLGKTMILTLRTLTIAIAKLEDELG